MVEVVYDHLLVSFPGCSPEQILELLGLIRIKASLLKQLHIRTVLTSGGTVADAEMNIRPSYTPKPKGISAHFA